MTVAPHPSAHELTNCHDIRHNGPGCPSCDGVKITCRTHKTPSGSHPALASGPEERTSSGGGSRISPHGSPRSTVVPNSIEVYLTATGTATSGRGEAFQVVKVQWSAWFSHVDGTVLVTVTAFGADRMQNATWYFSEGEPPEWVAPAPDWFHAAVEQMRAMESPAPQDDSDDYDDFAPGYTGGSIGPGNAGSYHHECGFYLSWPEWTTDEDRAGMLRMRDEHEAECTETADAGQGQS